MNRHSNQKYRTFFIIISSGLFVAIIIIVGLILFYPRSGVTATEPAPTAATADDGILFDPFAYLNSNRTDQANPDTPETPGPFSRPEILVEKNRSPATSALLPPDRPTASLAVPQPRPLPEPNRALEPRAAAPINQAHRAAAPEPQSAAVAPAARTPAEQAPGQLRAAGNRVQPLTKTQSAAIARATEAKKSTVASSAPAAAARALAPPTAAPSKLYWIQLFSSDSYENTERARYQLAAYQLDGIISEYHVRGKRYYRLRIGPYYNYQEAQKFLTWFRNGAVFNDGYVVQVSNR